MNTTGKEMPVLFTGEIVPVPHILRCELSRTYASIRGICMVYLCRVSRLLEGLLILCFGQHFRGFSRPTYVVEKALCIRVLLSVVGIQRFGSPLGQHRISRFVIGIFEKFQQVLRVCNPLCSINGALGSLLIVVRVLLGLYRHAA